ncbi:MAG: hypothetical protein Q7T11_00805 [Deltaproteobacteria bacterium]|nr:hypothetical protein [Deltaproteobacteria bacterium]
MGEGDNIFFKASPPGANVFYHDSDWCSGAGVEPGLRQNLVGQFDWSLSLPSHLYFCDRTAASVDLSIASILNRDNPTEAWRLFPSFSVGAQAGGLAMEDGPTGRIGVNGEVALVRLGPLTLSGSASVNYPFSFIGGATLGISLDTPSVTSGSSETEEETGTVAAPIPGLPSTGKPGETRKIEQRAEEPLSAGFSLGDFRTNQEMVSALASLLGVSIPELQAHLEKSDTLKPDDSIIKDSRLATLVEGGGETVIGILKSITPSRDHVLDPSDADIFYGMVRHIAMDLKERLEQIKKGAVYNDFQKVLKPDGKNTEVLERAYTGMYFPKKRYPNMSAQAAADLIGNHGEYDQWAGSYKVTWADDRGFLYFYLVSGVDAHGLDYNLPMKEFGKVRSNAWIPAKPLLKDYKQRLESHLEELREMTGESIHPTEAKVTYGGWTHIPMANGDTYSALYSFASTTQKDWMLAAAKRTIASETEMAYVKFAHGMGERSKDQNWIKPSNTSDWKMPFFKLGEGTTIPRLGAE